MLPILTLCSLVLASAPAAAPQKIDFPKPIRAPERPADRDRQQAGDGGEEAPPGPSQEPETTPPAEPGFWDQPAAAGLDPRVVEVLRAYEAEESKGTETRHRYLGRLRGFGLDRPRQAALYALTSPDLATVRLAAELLEFVGEVEDAETLVSTAAGVGEVPVAAACLETAMRLNGGWLPPRAVRLLDHPERGVRAAVEARLADLPDEGFVKPLLQKLQTGRDPDARLRAARLLRAFRARPEVRRALHRTLADPAVPVAFEACATLAGEGDEESVALLRQDILAAEPGQSLGYLLCALLDQQELLGRLLVDEELLPPLRDALRSPDLFVSGAAAACLAEYVFRAPESSLDPALEGEILHALVKAVGGMTFYPQYARFAELGERSLARVTGQDFSGRERNSWLAWYAGNADGFRLVRGQLQVTEADLPRLRLRWLEDGRERSLAGAGAAPAGEGERLLGQLGLVRLLSRLEQEGLLDTRILPGVYGPVGAEVRCRVEIEAGLKRKPLSFRGEAGADWLPGLLADLDRWYDELAWQALAPPGEERSFVLERLPRWDGAEREERLQFLIDVSRERAAALDADRLLAWCGSLAAEPDLKEIWPADLARILLDLVPVHAATPELSRRLLDLALLRPRPEDVGPVVDTLAGMSEPLRSELLQHALVALGAEAAAGALRDERLAVRVAAARALGRFGDAGRTALLAALDDPNALVVQMAARSLGQVGGDGVAERILPLVGPEHSRGVRSEALWALGQLAEPEALDAVVACCGVEQPVQVRLAAIRALGRLPGAEATRSFGPLFPAFAGGELELSWSRALGERGAAAAAGILRPFLDDPDPIVAARAAVLAGRLGEPAAAGPLVRLLADSPHDPELLDAMVRCCGLDFRSTPDPAGVYAAWWSESGPDDPSTWLERAAANAGLTLPEGFADPDRVSPVEAVAALTSLLEGGPPELRPMTALHLARITGLDQPAFRPDTPFDEVRRAAAAWRAWSPVTAGG
ncbi:MAG: HEAT repeat domain-containing protein [Planctomycetota bacterium]|nr:MAG: HEAT repeat domain-containing protein [Planctomycetota bacterium]